MHFCQIVEGCVLGNCEGGGERKKHFDEQVQEEKMEKISTVRPTDRKQCFEVSQKNT